MGEFSVSSVLHAPAPEVWRHAVSPLGVNRELRPALRMTFPAGVTNLTDSWKPGERMFRSWLLLGRIVPVDYDDVAFVEVEPGRRFLERSVLLSHRVWEHERSIEPTADGCRVTDRLRFVPRVGALAPLYRIVFLAVFRLRHRNLRRLFAGAES